MLEPPQTNGHVNVHREVAAQSIGRALNAEEVVHHIDEDKHNNDPENLIVFRTDADHRAHHEGMALIDHGDGTFSAERKEIQFCSCGKETTGKFFCFNCELKNRAKNIPPRGDLEAIIWEMPATKIAERYGVSDRMIGKWCAKYGIEKPGRGYWSRKT